jgi:hypothetical protein
MGICDLSKTGQKKYPRAFHSGSVLKDGFSGVRASYSSAVCIKIQKVMCTESNNGI